MKALFLVMTFLFAVGANAADDTCFFKKDINQCFELPAGELNAATIVPIDLARKICVKSVCIHNNPDNSKAKPLITIDGEGYNGLFVAKAREATDHDGDRLYGYYRYEVQLHDSVVSSGQRKVSCPNDTNPNCYWYEYDAYSSTTMTLEMRTFGKAEIDQFDFSVLFYNAGKAVKNGSVVQSIRYKPVQ